MNLHQSEGGKNKENNEILVEKVCTSCRQTDKVVIVMSLVDNDAESEYLYLRKLHQRRSLISKKKFYYIYIASN